MKIALSMLVVLLLGAVLGVVLAVSEFSPVPSILDGMEGAEQPIAGPVADAQGMTGKNSKVNLEKEQLPKIKINQETYDFGSMEDSQKGHHEFVIQNVGTAPLTLKVDGTSCKCTKGEVEKDRLYPGEKTKLIFEWDPKGYTGNFEQTATLSTNDPDHDKIKLKVKGRVHAPMALVPRTIVFGDITNRYEAEGTVRLYLFEEPDTKIESIRFLGKKTASYYSTSFEKLPPKEVQLLPDAKAGYLVHVKIKPGMIQGPIHQKAEIVTNSKKLGSIELPIEGKVVGNISVYGAGWDGKRSLFRLRTVNGQQGIKKTLMVVVHHVKGQSEPLRIASVTPSETLKASLSKSKNEKNEEVSYAKLTIEIPPGTSSANHLGSPEAPFGHIILESGGPGGSKFDLRVKFLVQGQ